MTPDPNKLSRFWQELKRRKVVRVITVYAAAAFVILELVSIIVEPLRLPEWTLTLVIVLLCAGFIIAVILSWVFDVTPEGVKKTVPLIEGNDRKHEKPSRLLAWKITSYVSIAIIAGLLIYNALPDRKKVKWSDLERTIAVLPFEDLGMEGRLTSLQNTLPIALITELQNVQGFIIRPWGSTEKYLATELSSSAIGNELNSNFLVKGFLTPQGNDIEVDIWLINAASEEIIKSYSNKLEASDIFQIRGEISKQVASVFNQNFNPALTVLSNNPDAEQTYFTGLSYYWGDETREHFLMAINYFEKAIQLDPGFTLAYVRLASSNCWMYHFYYDRTQERLSLARNAIERAYDTDPGNPDILLAEANYFYVTHNYEKALEKFRMASGRVSDHVEYNLILGSLHRRQGELEKASEYYLTAGDLSPQNKIIVLELAETNLLLRKYERAEEYFGKYTLMGGRYKTSVNKVHLYLMWENGNEKSRRALDELRILAGERTDPFHTHLAVKLDLIDKKYKEALNTLVLESSDSIYDQFIYRPRTLYFAEIYRMQNQTELANLYYDSARIHLQAKIAASPLDSRYHSSLGIAYAGLGRKNEAIREGERAISLMPLEKDFYRGIFRLEDMARIYTMVGEYGSAVEQLDQLLSMPGLISVNLLKKDPTWEALWDRPEFVRLLEVYSEN
ncbi:MAG TPA: tetratricopeptide repeat protein [Salinimicrobium catena]|uniref:Tetratricopeptide repeat protein n=1 Tax=Salinimicrobium catena TaxID=390640 RepID=A0A7C2R532_9FLAO|nr:tetratricopeptide repeat protein [Salinimicrobium catena]